LPNQVGTSQVIRFATFEVDLQAQELRKAGLRLKLTGQPFQVLAILLEQRGVVVTRDELQRRLWPDTFVDVDHNLNTAINKIREALSDTAENPRFIETLPRRGYRFIGAIEGRAQEIPKLSGADTKTRGAWRRVAALILVGAVCTLAALFTYLRLRPHLESESVPLIPLPFTALPGVETLPAFSPDGSRIAFARKTPDAKDFDLYVKAFGSETLVRLTQHPSEFLSPAWSPDGTQIAFHRLSGSDTGIYVVPALGGSERRLRSTRVPFETAVPISWSPDGKLIAFTDISPGEPLHPRVYLLSVETLESRQIPHAPKCVAEGLPTFSHSGEELAYECLHTWDEFDIYSVALSGGTPKLIATHSEFPMGMAWSGDDKRLLFSEGYSLNELKLNEIMLADGSVRRVPIAQNPAFPAVSPKGDRLAYAAGADEIDIWRRDLLHPESPAVKLLSSTREQEFPQYSPDGKHIAFESNRAGPFEVWISDADGSNLVQISNLKSGAGGARWSPDAKKIAFASDSFSRSEVYVADISEVLPHKVVTNVPSMSSPSWSHDGKWIYFTDGPAAESRIYRCPAAGGDAVLLSAQAAYSPLESLDGRTIYFGTRPSRPTLETLPAERPGTESPLEGMPRLLSADFWTITAGGIYFVPADAPRSFRYFDFNTRKIRQVFEVQRRLAGGMSVSPDGRWILYSEVDEENRDIMLIDHFR